MTVWPATLPQDFRASNYTEAMPENRIIDNYEAGPPFYRRRTTANPLRVSGSMYMTNEEWVILKDFFTNETLDGVLTFNIDQVDTSGEWTWLVRFVQPPTRTVVEPDFFDVSLVWDVFSITEFEEPPPPPEPEVDMIGITITGMGSVIPTGPKGYVYVGYDCTITDVSLLADQIGSIIIDIWKDSYANYPPNNSDSITASSPPTLSSGIQSQDSTLSGWTTAISAGDVLGFNVDSCSTITQVTLNLTILKAV
jgi:hypothetical protein